MIHPAECGPCEDCAEFLADVAHDRAGSAVAPRGDNRKSLPFLDPEERPTDITVVRPELRRAILEADAAQRRTAERRGSRAAVARRLRAEGLVVGAIADRMGVSDKTVRNYLAGSREA